jgi:hypothetical protein
MIGTSAGRLAATVPCASEVGWNASCGPKNAACFAARNSLVIISADAVSYGDSSSTHFSGCS